MNGGNRRTEVSKEERCLKEKVEQGKILENDTQVL